MKILGSKYKPPKHHILGIFNVVTKPDLHVVIMYGFFHWCLVVLGMIMKTMGNLCWDALWFGDHGLKISGFPTELASVMVWKG